MTIQFPFNFESHTKKQLLHEAVRYLYAIVEKACRSSQNKFGYSIWQNHILLTVRYAKMLAQQLGADEEVCEISALLHDYAGILDFDQYENHHVYGARIAHELLVKLGFPKEKIEQVKYCILTHRASKNIPRKTTESNILASADAIAHILAYESLFDLAFYDYHYQEDQARIWVLKKLSRSYNKIMPEAQPLIEEKYKRVKMALDSHVPVLNIE